MVSGKNINPNLIATALPVVFEVQDLHKLANDLFCESASIRR